MRISMTRFAGAHRHRLRSLLLTAVSLSGVVACSSPDLNGPQSKDLTQLPWTLSLNTHAITMDTATGYNTYQLTAVPRTIDGNMLTGAPAVTFTSSDSSLRVNSDGLLSARKARNSIRVVASLVYQGVRISDTAVVNITATSNRRTFRTLHFQLQSGDTPNLIPPNDLGNAIYYESNKTLEVEARDSAGGKIPSSVVALSISDPLQARWGTGGPGGTINTTTTASTATIWSYLLCRSGVPVTVYASATVYGVTMQDSLQLLVTDPLFFIYTVSKSTESSTPVFSMLPFQQTTIAVGGWVWWINHTTAADSLDVVFDDPSGVSEDPFLGQGPGDIDPFPGDPDPSQAADFTMFLRSRQFLQAGTFRWHSTRMGLSGTIVVQ